MKQENVADLLGFRKQGERGLKSSTSDLARRTGIPQRTIYDSISL